MYQCVTYLQFRYSFDIICLHIYVFEEGEKEKENGNDLLYSDCQFLITIFTEHLGSDDLGYVLETLFTVKDKWYYIGLQLNISHPILDAIEREKKDNRERLTQMLKLWLADTSSPATWSGLVQALLSVSVGEKELAEDTRKTRCSQNEEQTTGTAPSEGRERRRTYIVKK